MPKITPFLWFETEAEEAANFYVSVFKNSKITDILRNGEGGPGPAGSVLTIAFELDGKPFVALNGGPQFKFSEAVSFAIECGSQSEVDDYWEKLTAGGEPGPCGWLKDRFGLSWQVTPKRLIELLNDPDAGRSRRAFEAMMQMGKIEIAKIEEAAAV